MVHHNDRYIEKRRVRVTPQSPFHSGSYMVSRWVVTLDDAKFKTRKAAREYVDVLRREGVVISENDD